MQLQDRTIAELGRCHVVDRPALRKYTRIDGLAVLAGSWPHPGAIKDLERQAGDPKVRNRINSIRIQPLEELPDIVVRADGREVVRSNERCRPVGQIDRLRISRVRGRGRTVGKDKSGANQHLFFDGSGSLVNQRIRLMRGDFLIVAIMLECFFAACRTPFAKISRRLLRRRIKRKHPRVSRRHRIGDKLNLADKSPSLFRRPENTNEDGVTLVRLPSVSGLLAACHCTRGVPSGAVAIRAPRMETD